MCAPVITTRISNALFGWGEELSRHFPRRRSVTLLAIEPAVFEQLVPRLAKMQLFPESIVRPQDLERLHAVVGRDGYVGIVDGHVWIVDRVGLGYRLVGERGCGGEHEGHHQDQLLHGETPIDVRGICVLVRSLLN